MGLQQAMRCMMLILLALPPVAAAQQSAFSKLLDKATHSLLTRAAAQPNTSDGIHASTGLDGRWLYPGFVPPVINGYTLIRYGTSALDPFDNGIGGRPTCDPEFIGYAALRRTRLTAADLTRCVDLEQLNEAGATAATLYRRMAAIASTHKFYIRGTVTIYRHDQVFIPPEDNPPAGSVLVVFTGNFISGPSDDTAASATGLGWRAAPPGEMLYKIVVHADLSNMVLGQISTHSYIFFSVGDAIRDTKTMLSGKVYEVPVTIDKIILADGSGRQIDVVPPGSSSTAQ